MLGEGVACNLVLLEFLLLEGLEHPWLQVVLKVLLVLQGFLLVLELLVQVVVEELHLHVP